MTADPRSLREAVRELMPTPPSHTLPGAYCQGWADCKTAVLALLASLPEPEAPWIEPERPERCGAMRVATRETCALENDHDGMHWFASEQGGEALVREFLKYAREYDEPEGGLGVVEWEVIEDAATAWLAARAQHGREGA